MPALGRRGPAPMPSVIRKVRGNAGKRPINDREPEFSPADAAALEAPAFLTAEARAEWDRVAPELSNNGLLAGVDRMALAGYCQSYARWVEAENEITAKGSTMTLYDDDGAAKYVQQSPYVGIARAALDHMRRFAAEFGMTPSARSRVATPEKGAADPWAAFGLIDGGTSGVKKRA